MYSTIVYPPLMGTFADSCSLKDQCWLSSLKIAICCKESFLESVLSLYTSWILHTPWFIAHWPRPAGISQIIQKKGDLVHEYKSVVPLPRLYTEACQVCLKCRFIVGKVRICYKVWYRFIYPYNESQILKIPNRVIWLNLFQKSGADMIIQSIVQSHHTFKG